MMMQKKIGVLGGGQLGKMLYQSASELCLDIHFLDQSEDGPVAKICPHFTQGDFQNFEDVMNFGKDKDLLTIEIESVNVDALEALEKSGKEIYPQPSVIKLIQDKGLQKSFLQEYNIKTAPFHLVSSKKELLAQIESGVVQLPFVLKIRKGGYDGRGVQIIRALEDLKQAFDAPCVVENLVPIAKELAVIVASGIDDDIQVYEPVDMVFDHSANLLDYQIAPVDISDQIKEAAKQLALTTAKAIGIRGILAVEIFLDEQNQLWVNELAPRPHNSGHHTIEAHETSQYEQHLRCVLGVPLGSTKMTQASVLLNILGAADHTGPAIYEGLEECLALEGAHFHIYGKAETKPFRKMGHVTVTAKNTKLAMAGVQKIKQTLKVISHGRKS